MQEEEGKADFGQLGQKTSLTRNTAGTWSCRICCSWSLSSATLRLMSSRLAWTAEVPALRGWLVGPVVSRVLRVFPAETWGVPVRKEQQDPENARKGKVGYVQSSTGDR